MSVDLGLLGTWQGEPLTSAARRAVEAGEQIQLVLAALLAASPGTPSWAGQAATAVAARHDDRLDEVVRLADVAAEVGSVLARAAGRVQSAGDLARAAARLAEPHGFVVTGSGQVLDPAVPFDGGGSPERHAVEALVRAAQAEADQVDADLAAALAALALRFRTTTIAAPPAKGALLADSGSSALAVVGAVAGPRVGPPGEPGRAATLAWWGGLTDEARRSAVVDSPDLVGGTDGIPAWARDRSNRIRLRRAEQDLSLEAERLRPPAGSGMFDLGRGLAGAATVGTLDGPSRRAAYLEVRSKLSAVRAIEQVLDRPDGRARQLLVLDLSGRSAKAAVAVGDVDRAQHLAVVVPGFTTTVQGDLPGSDALAADLRDVARRESMAWGDRGEVAVVSWLGYDAPQVADSLRSHSVVLRSSATAGAAALNPFLGGLPVGAHVTVVGHSYGSTTAGLAVAAGGTGVGDVVAIGSPGLGIESTTALGLPPSRVHVIEAADDPVADLGWFGRDPARLAGVDLLAADTAQLGDGTVGTPSRGHSQYLSPGTTSQWNIAAVVVGVSTATRPVERRAG